MEKYFSEIREYLESKGLKVENYNGGGLEVMASGSPTCVSLAREGFHRSLKTEGASFPERAEDGKGYGVRYLGGYDFEKRKHGIEESFGILVGNPGREIRVVMRKI
jgi:hypothetical protein